MRRLFGLPIESLALGLSIAVGIAVAITAVLALRHRVFFRLGVRNINRRMGRSLLIVVGLMLATSIIAAALGTGDTMGRNVRAAVIQSLGGADEWITVKGAKPDVNRPLGLTPGLAPFRAGAVAAVERGVRGTDLVDGVVPAVVRTVAVQDVTARQTEPAVTLFAPDPARLRGFDAMVGTGGRPADLRGLAVGEVLLERHAADALDARRGDRITVFSGSSSIPLRVADIVSFRGGGSSASVLILPLAHAQAALGLGDRVEEILVSNRGGFESGADTTTAVVQRLRPTLASEQLAIHPLKRDGLRAADVAGGAFMSMFSTFGSFSIAAGILLIFLIFVMLAAERRTDMGVARAIGMQRIHLVEMFVFEGAAYDLMAALVGALLGVAVSFAMVMGIGRAFAAQGIEIHYSVRWQSVVVAYALGVLLTFLVVVFSAWRVSVLNIVTAVRNLPDPTRRLQPRRGIVAAIVLLGSGSLLVATGVSSSHAMPFLLGGSLLFVGLVPVTRALRVPDRVGYTIAGLGIVALWLLPFRVVERFVPGAQMDFSLWVVGGLLIVLGATWTVVYNADLLLGAAMNVFGRIRSLSAVLRVSMAYPLRTRLRTGMTLAMFTLVVFTLVVGITTPSSFMASLNKLETYGGGFDVRATTPASVSAPDFGATVRRALGPNGASIRSVAGTSSVPVRARAGTSGAFMDYVVHGLDSTFRSRARYALGSRAAGYHSDRAVWDAVGRGANLAVVDPWIVKHRRNWNFGAVTPLKLHGLYAEDRTFRNVTVDVRDPQSGRVTRFTVVGVLRDSMPLDMLGIATSQSAATRLYGTRAVITSHFIQLRAGVNATHFATRLESALLAYGVQADSFQSLVDHNRNGSLVFLRLIEGFMGLGLIVGVAALGVIAARSVVERRQQIGVLRAIGFHAASIRLGFLLESGLLALTSIVVGSGLGLVMASNVIDDAQRQATWPGVRLVVPWLNLSIVFLVVMVVALATTYLPARRASRIYPAEALRYQ